MFLCRTCGRQVDATAAFCPGCGRREPVSELDVIAGGMVAVGMVAVPLIGAAYEGIKNLVASDGSSHNSTPKSETPHGTLRVVADVPFEVAKNGGTSDVYIDSKWGEGTVTIDVPAGVESGHVIRFDGMQYFGLPDFAVEVVLNVLPRPGRNSSYRT